MYSVEKKSAEWLRECGQSASKASFGESRSRDLDRAGFALVSYADGRPTGYVTCIEMDAETLYWQIGGAFFDTQGTLAVVPCYTKMIDWSLEQYKRITTRIENTNVRMLHLAMKMGFRIVGVWNFQGKVYCELLNEGNHARD